MPTLVQVRAAIMTVLSGVPEIGRVHDYERYAKQEAKFGAPAEIVEACTRPKEIEAFEVLPENWPALELFLSLETQWRHAGMGGVPTGIDYGSLPIVTAALGQTLDRALLMQLKEMEAAALKALGERWRQK